MSRVPPRWGAALLALSLGTGCPGPDDGKGGEYGDTAEEELPDWCLANEETDWDFRGVHSTTNNGLGFYQVRDLRTDDSALDDYFEFVGRVNANWIGVNIALQFDSALDTELSTDAPEADVEPPNGTPTYSDEDLENIMDAVERYEAASGEDLHVYWTVTLEPSAIDPDGCDDHERDMMGWAWADALEHGAGAPSDLDCETGDSNYPYDEDDWFWGKGEDNESVQAFWASYTELTVHYATIAADRNVEMFGVGGEAQGLFRTQWFDSDPSSAYPNSIQALVDAVREVYSGFITYDMLHTSFHDYGNGDHEMYMALWDDIDFDVIGVSAYFQLLETEPSDPDADLPLSTYEDAWDTVFEDDLADIAEDHDQPIVFLEYGYAADYRAGYAPDEHMYEARTTSADGIDHGEMAQSLIHTAFMNRRNRCNDIVEGIFAWGDPFASTTRWEGGALSKTMANRQWEDEAGNLHHLSEQALSEGFGSWQ